MLNYIEKEEGKAEDVAQQVKQRTTLPMARIRGEARWAGRPACGPSTEEGGQDLITGWPAGVARIVKFQVLWKTLPEYIRWSKKPLGVNRMLAST